MKEEEDVKILEVISMLLNKTQIGTIMCCIKLTSHPVLDTWISRGIRNIYNKIPGLSPVIQVIHIQEALWTTSKPNFNN